MCFLSHNIALSWVLFLEEIFFIKLGRRMLEVNYIGLLT